METKVSPGEVFERVRGGGWYGIEVRGWRHYVEWNDDKQAALVFSGLEGKQANICVGFTEDNAVRLVQYMESIAPLDQWQTFHDFAE